MRSWTCAIALDASLDAPLFLQIARAISDDVRRGRLRPGDALPGSRTLATSLAVHRNTVLAAYRELAVEGWITAERAGGTFVSTELPDPSPRRFSRAVATRESTPTHLGFDLAPHAHPWTPRPEGPRGTLVLASGVPDLRLLSTAPLARAYRSVLRARGRSLLDYGDARGDERMRVALSEMLSALRGVAATSETVLVTRGSQMAIDLLARCLLAPGDLVAVEALGYRPAWAALRSAGARLAPIAVDAGGMRIDALEALAAREPVRAVYVTPHHQYPTTVVMPAGRRLALLELARARRIAVIEDDYDFEFHYEGRPVLPLASADRAGVVAYVGTLSKILAPGLRLGFLVAPQPLIARAASVRAFVDRQGDHAIERAVAELIDDGEVQRHARRVRRVYQSRRDALIEALSAQLGSAIEVTEAMGGMALWARVDPSLDVEEWAERALEHGASFTTARHFAFDGGSRPFVRLGFASLDEAELREAVRRMAVARRGLSAKTSRPRSTKRSTQTSPPRPPLRRNAAQDVGRRSGGA